MNFKEIEVYLKEAGKRRMELKEKSIEELRILLENLKDAEDYIGSIQDEITRKIAKIEDVIGDIFSDMIEDGDMFDDDDDDDLL